MTDGAPNSTAKVNTQQSILRHRLRWLLPTPGNVLFSLLLIAGLWWANGSNAAPALPISSASSLSTIPYQGRLADTDGAAVTGTVPMHFRLYASQIGGSPLWSEVWSGPNSVQVNGGLFNVLLGSLMPIPQTVITLNNTLWLGITVGADSEMAPASKSVASRMRSWRSLSPTVASSLPRSPTEQ